MQFRLDVDCYAVDDRITTAGPLSTYFSIRLPHHLFDSSDNSVTLISPVVSVSNLPTSSNHNTGTSIARQLFTKPCGGATTPPPTTTDTSTSLLFTSPRMGFLSKSSSSSSNTFIRSYYGSFDFLNDDKKISTTFGHNPILLHGYPISCSKNDASNVITKHMYKCRLDVFMWLCEQDYVGITSSDQDLSLIELR